MVESLTISNSGSTIASLYSGETLSSAATPSSVSKAAFTLVGSFNDASKSSTIASCSEGVNSPSHTALYIASRSVISPVATSTVSDAVSTSSALDVIIRNSSPKRSASSS